MYKIALSGQMFDDFSIWDHLEAVYAFGYDAAEIRSTHLHPGLDAAQKEEIHRYLARNEIAVNCLSCFVGNYGLLTDGECAEAFAVFERYLALAVEFGVPLLRVWPAWEASATAGEAVFGRAAEWMRRSADAAARCGVRLAMETHHGTLCDTPQACLRLLEAIGRENVGLILDPVNLYQTPVDDLPACVHALKGHIFQVHVKDIQRLRSGAHPGCFPYRAYADHIGRFTKVVPPQAQDGAFYAHRRIGCGGVDWPGVLQALEQTGFDGMLVVESVAERDALMPRGRELARACREDLLALLRARPALRQMHAVSPQARGLHAVITPATHPCHVSHLLRLNLGAGETFLLETGELEMNAALICGRARVAGALEAQMGRLDSFYLPGGSALSIKAGEEGCSFYIGAAPCDGVGKAFLRPFVPQSAGGAFWDVHGTGAGRRDVFFTLDEATPASRLICGLTWGGDGAWTSWPPHQHERDLEESYCYFDMDPPQCGLHLSYPTDEPFAAARVDVVSSGHYLLVAGGYHPTVATPGTRNAYFWVLCAHSHAQRSYGLAKTDPALA